VPKLQQVGGDHLLVAAEPCGHRIAVALEKTELRRGLQGEASIGW